jgi:hypothetical protein
MTESKKIIQIEGAEHCLALTYDPETGEAFARKIVCFALCERADERHIEGVVIDLGGKLVTVTELDNFVRYLVASPDSVLEENKLKQMSRQAWEKRALASAENDGESISLPLPGGKERSTQTPR